jgi:hypothetical protein
VINQRRAIQRRAKMGFLAMVKWVVVSIIYVCTVDPLKFLIAQNIYFFTCLK